MCCSLIRLRLVVLADLEVSQLVRLLVGRHHSQPVTQVVFLQVLLGEVLQIPEQQRCGCSVAPQTGSSHACVGFKCRDLISPFGKLLLRGDVDLVLHAADVNDAAQIPRLSVDLDPLFEEGFLWTDKSDVLGKGTLVQTRLQTRPKQTAFQ